MRLGQRAQVGIALRADQRRAVFDFNVFAMVAEEAAIVVGAFADDWTHRGGN